MERVSITEARAATGEVRGTLAVLGSRCPKRTALRLCALIERLADALDDAQREMRRRDDLTTPYATLVEEWNALVAGLRDLGVVISQPAPGPAWRWGWGGQSGEAPTMAAAYLAALRSAGLGRPADAPAALDPPRLCDHCGLPLMDGRIRDEVVLECAGRRMATHHACAEHLRARGWAPVAVARS